MLWGKERAREGDAHVVLDAGSGGMNEGVRPMFWASFHPARGDRGSSFRGCEWALQRLPVALERCGWPQAQGQASYDRLGYSPVVAPLLQGGEVVYIHKFG